MNYLRNEWGKALRDYRWWMLVVGLCAGLVASCGTGSTRRPGPDVRHIDSMPSGYDVNRTVDRGAGVVCYTYHSGISCLPIAETSLEPQP